MSQANILGEPMAFEWDDPRRGRLALSVYPLDFGGESAIQRKLEDRALKAVQRHREAMSIFDYELSLSGWRRDCAAGVYEYGSMVAFDWLYTLNGWCYRAWLMLRDAGQTVAEEMVARIAAADAKRQELDAIIKAVNDPGRRRPPATQAAAGGSPSATPAPSSPASPGVTLPARSAVSPAAG